VPQHEPDGPVERAAEEFVDAVDAAVDRVLPPHLRLRAWARRRRTTHVVWRASVLLLGMTLVLAGLVMLVLPGPGWAAIILGLVVLASEFAWAHRLLEPVRRWARAAAAKALDPRARRRNLAILAGAVVALAAAAAWYVSRYGLTAEGVTSLLPG
jgi:uncharacterized protein (TIGR02611 family)